MKKVSYKELGLVNTKKLPFKVTVLSVAPLIGEAIRRIHEDESVNSLFG